MWSNALERYPTHWGWKVHRDQRLWWQRCLCPPKSGDPWTILLFLDLFCNSRCNSYEGRHNIDLLHGAGRQLTWVVCFNSCLPFVTLDDVFCCGWVLARTFFIVCGRAVGGCVWLGVGSVVLKVWGGDRCICSRIGDGHDYMWSGCVSRNIEPGAVFDWLVVIDT
jgi:hypothetical protein